MTIVKTVLSLVLCAILIASCKTREDCVGVAVVKLEVPLYKCPTYDSTDPHSISQCEECYAATCLDVDNPGVLDTVDQYVLKNYSKQLSHQYKLYEISVYKYDFAGKNGFSEQSDLRKGGALEEHSDWIILHYGWEGGGFTGRWYVRRAGDMIKEDTPKLFRNLVDTTPRPDPVPHDIPGQ